MKRFLVICLALVCMTLALSACGTNSPARRSATQVPPATLAAIATDVATFIPEASIEPAPSPETIASTNVLTIAVNAAFEPFVFLDDTKAITGFDVDLLHAIGDRVGLDIAFVDVPFSDVLDGVARGQYDAGAGGITVTPQRTQRMAFTAPYFTSLDAPAAALDAGQALVVAADNTTVTDISSLTPEMSVGAQQGTTGATYVTQSTPALLAAFRTADDALNAVADGKIEAAVIDVPVVTMYTAANPNKVKVIGSPVTIESYAFTVNPAKPELLARLDQGLAAVRNSGTYKQLIDRWFTSH